MAIVGWLVALLLGIVLALFSVGNQQPAALQLFRSLGYEEIADYNGNPHATYWFEKVL